MVWAAQRAKDNGKLNSAIYNNIINDQNENQQSSLKFFLHKINQIYLNTNQTQKVNQTYINAKRTCINIKQADAEIYAGGGFFFFFFGNQMRHRLLCST